MKKWIFIILILGLILGSFNFAFSQEKVKIHFFYGRVCPHCATEKEFLNKIEKKYPELEINHYLISDPKNQEFLKKLCQKCDAEKYLGLVPLTFVNDSFFLGFDNAAGIGKEIEESIQNQLGKIEKPDDANKKINLPIIGKLDISEYSLPVLTIILGFLDGFNVCSLGALVLILGLCLALKSKKKILFFGGIFILISAIIYGLLIVLWYKLFSFLNLYINIMQLIIGVLALGGGIYFFRQFLKFQKQGAVCEIEGGQKIASKFFTKIQKSFKKSKNIFTILSSICLFAAIITIVEFPCSAAVPVVYAGILSQAQTPSFQYIFYIALFVLFYMFDEIVVFLIAVFTTTIWIGSKKFITWITLIEAIMLSLFGIYYLFGF